jgi:hypothetical protein
MLFHSFSSILILLCDFISENDFTYLFWFSDAFVFLYSDNSKKRKGEEILEKKYALDYLSFNS